MKIDNFGNHFPEIMQPDMEYIVNEIKTSEDIKTVDDVLEYLNTMVLTVPENDYIPTRYINTFKEYKDLVRNWNMTLDRERKLKEVENE